MQLLIQHNADPNAPDEHGDTPLHFIQTAKGAIMLVDAKADVDYKSPNGGWTALLNATHHGRVGVVQVLLELSANPEIQATVMVAVR